MRLARNNFLDNELRYENALKFTPKWVEAFLIFSIVWTFTPVLSENGKRRLDQKVREKYEAARSDFGQYSRDKKKIQGREKATLPGATGKNLRSLSGTQCPDPNRNSSGLTLTWTADPADAPMFISNFPETGSFQEYYFDLDESEWVKFDLNSEIKNSLQRFRKLVPSQQRIENLFVPSHSNIIHSYILECLLTNQTSTLVIGPGCSGRSALLRNLLFDAAFEFSKNLMTEHVTMSDQSTLPCEASMPGGLP